MPTILFPQAPTEAPERLPRLENGDRLSRAELERRYHAMRGLRKAELIEGVVYVPSPVTHRDHSGPHADAVWWLGQYRAATPGVDGGDNASLRMDLGNEPQPDAFLFYLPERQGQAYIDEEGYVAGAPELVMEIAATSVSYDLGQKLHAYRKAGVREYVAYRVLDREVDWFVLRGGAYVRLPLGEDGIYRSEIFPSLYLNVPALIARNLPAMAAALQCGLDSEEHAEFAAR